MNKLKLLTNLVKTILEYKRKKVKISNNPLLLWIEPTNKCNLKCIMCPNQSIPDEMLGFMDWDLFVKIINEIKDYVPTIYLLLAGESLLHKDVYKMIRYAADNKIRVLLNTNGTTLINRDNRQRLLESGVAHITFAFDGYNKRTYENIRVGAKYEIVLNGILEFLKEKKEKNKKYPYIAIANLEVGNEQYIDKKKEKKEFIRSFDGLKVDEFIVKTPNTWGGTFAECDEFNHHEFNNANFYPCSHLWSTMSICWDGTVVPCCFDFFKTYVLGDVNKSTLKEIWNGKPMLELRSSMLDGTYKSMNKLCNNCVILHLDPVLGIPAGMRTTIKDSMTLLFGLQYEKYFIKIAKKIKSGYSLQIDD